MPDSIDPRRRIPRTDALLVDAEIAAAAGRVGPGAAHEAVRAAQQLARDGAIEPDEVRDEALRLVSDRERGTSLRPVLNATGVVIHTNLGRAPLSAAARAAVAAASGYVDVEFDLASGKRAPRGRAALDALRSACPQAGAALVVNNGAAALALVVTALATECERREVLISRGELVEIGDGFRLPDLLTSTGATLREVGTTNRTALADYERAAGPGTALILKVHPSNFRISGFTGAAAIPELAGLAGRLGVPLVMDIGSGLLAPDRDLPDEPDAGSTLAAGADLVTASGDKLLGGPQAGLILGRADLVEVLRRHPLQRAFRADKLTLAALAATLRGPYPPVTSYRSLTAEALRLRTERFAAGLPDSPQVVPVEGRVGGGSAPDVALPGWAVALPEWYAAALRAGTPAVVARLEGGRCLIDLRCIEPDDEASLAAAISAAVARRDIPDR